MLPLQFFGQNFHFALNLFFSLAAFATFWLYFDAWLVGRKFKEVFKWFGFLLLSFSFVFEALTIEQSVLGASLLGSYSENISLVIRVIAYAVLIYALVTEPLQKVPDNQGLNLNKNNSFLGLGSFSFSLKYFLPIGALIISLLYYRKASTGLERHLKQIAFAFLFLFLSETVSLSSLFRESTNINIYNLTASFGPLWIIEQIFLLIATIFLGKWVWSYLVKRIQSQLFMIFTTSILIIFLIVSISFTFLLVRNIQTQTLANLETAAKVLDYSFETKRSEVGAQSEVFSANPAIQTAIINKNHDQLVSLIESGLENKKINSIIVTTETGQVLARAEDPEDWGDSLSSDALVRKALSGKSEANLVAKEGVVAPIIYLQAAKPVLSASKVVGTVVVGVAISNNFLDGIKASTGLDSAVYANNTRSATTLVSPNSSDRIVGAKEENKTVLKQVLDESKTFKGSLSILNRPFLAVYQPLKNVNNEVIGMSFTGQPEILILRASGRSIELTFLISVLLLVISIVPAYLISKYISNQIH